MKDSEYINIVNASENNLRSVSLKIPRNKLVVVTGVSGSGKSSLIFDVLYREAESLFLGSFSSYARQFLGRMKRPDVEKVEGLSPAIAIDQRSVIRNPRSTVGTITEIYDYLRLLFARVGKAPVDLKDIKIERSLFSFNSPSGACPLCKGLGVEDRLDPELLVADASKSLRDRALAITAPNGYIIYSQVTMDVMDQVCRAEGFNVDIPWKELTDEQKHIVLYGSDKIEVPYGKHTLESRMTWSGITAKPREMGYYKGIIPVMETILKRDRNKNILRFVRTGQCSACQGKRLNDQALSVLVNDWDIAWYTALSMDQLQAYLNGSSFSESEIPVVLPIIKQISKRIDLLTRLGLGYLSPERESTTLSGGETQRMRLAVQSGTSLQGILYIFDEPSIGLHPRDTQRLIRVLEDLRDQGNSVIVVEHEEEFIRHADWLIDLGPGAGVNGGQVLHNIPASMMYRLPDSEIRKSRTFSFFKGIERIPIPAQRGGDTKRISVTGATHHNLKNIYVEFHLGELNVVTGISGAGKSSLVIDILGNFLHNQLNRTKLPVGSHKEITGWEPVSKVITIDQSPIGRTPRSNPATYTGLFDLIRDLYSEQPRSKELGYGKNRFSFNTEGGRCESCDGAGYIQVGMHFMGTVEILCESCEGKRFNNETLGVKYKGKNIAEVLEMDVTEAKAFFYDQTRLLRYLVTLEDLGLGYLKLGQRSSTLSGGEAQRIKLATELARPQSDHTLYILDEPTTGMHQADVKNLLSALSALIEQGNTIILIEHHLGIVAAASHIIDLGPESGDEGGRLLVSGTPEEVMACNDSWTGKALREYRDQQLAVGGGQWAVGGQQLAVGSWQLAGDGQQLAVGGGQLAVGGQQSIVTTQDRISDIRHQETSITFKGITTNNLKNLDVSIPHNKITVITGVSGSGKSSLAFDTVFAEGMNRFLESFSSYVRTRIGIRDKADFEEVSGLTTALGVDQRTIGSNPRSTVGTITGIYDLYRLLFSRIGIPGTGSFSPVLSSLFSFNHQHGACENCKGLGSVTVCDPAELIINPEKSILEGAMDGTKTGRFYGDPFGQYVSTLRSVAEKHGVSFSKPWTDLGDNERSLVLYGTGDEIYDVTWSFKRDQRTGQHHFQGKWTGLVNLVNDEYERKHADHRGQEMLSLMKEACCPLCKGGRLNKEALTYRVSGLNIAELSSFSIVSSIEYFQNAREKADPSQKIIADALTGEIIKRLEFISDLGLSYLTINRLTSTLSGGESQRIKLSCQVGSGLTGVTYVLDEPTIGLHSTDVSRLMKMIRNLQQSDNTVIIVEHDREVILAADHVIDLGPGAGRNGGRILAEGTPMEIQSNKNSITGRYLSLNTKERINKSRLLKKGIDIKNASANNLKGFDLLVPSGGMVVITGVSGSGKSTLVYDVIHSSGEKGKPAGCTLITGLDAFHKVIAVHQRSQFSNSNGTPATFTGLFDPIRDLFARTTDAKILNIKKNQFSFFNKEGRCEHCQGMGKIRISMDFLSDVWLPCEECHGKRYKEDVLHCSYKGKNIAEVLAMTFEEADIFFGDQKILSSQLKLMKKTGLGYLELGQSLDTLSGGESQRLLLASELMKPYKGKSLYLFEEPSTGLHFSDIEYLLTLFDELVDQGNTLIVIEHDPDIISKADWIIDLGPEGGEKGGYIIAEGTPADIMQNENSATGSILASGLKNFVN